MAKIGLQLWTIREEMDRDFWGTLQKVADMGYDGVEFAGGLKEKSGALELRVFLEKQGLETAGVIMEIERLENELSRVVDYSCRLGAPTVVCPYLPHEKMATGELCRRMAESFNKIGNYCRTHGLDFLYHVHGNEFFDVNGKTALERLLEETNPGMVQLEIDVYWVEHAGVHAMEFVKKYGWRAPSFHMKDMRDRETKEDTEVGTGVIDMMKLARMGLERGVKWLIVEQEQFRIPPMESAAIGLENLRKIVRELQSGK